MPRRPILTLCVLLATASLAPAASAAPARRPARPAAMRPPAPRLLLTYPPGFAGGADLRALAAAFTAALRAEPLTIDDLGIAPPGLPGAAGKPTSPARWRWELQRRRLQHWQVTLRLVRLESAVTPGSPPSLTATARVTLTLTRPGRQGKPVTLLAEGRVVVPSSAPLMAEVLAARQAALEAVARAALADTLARLLGKR